MSEPATQQVRDAADPTELAESLGPASARLLVLDFDGVLAPIVDRPEDARPTPGVLDALRTLQQTTTVAVVSGRPLADLVPRLGGLTVTYGGAHGAELRYADGSDDHLVDPGDVVGLLDAIAAELDRVIDDAPGWLLERKPTAVAVHHRLAPADDVEQRLPRIEATFAHHAQEPPGFEVLHGKAVIELRPSGVDKGEAVRRIAARTTGLTPLVLGDDATDEDAFAAATALGGTGVLVADEPRPTLAEHRLPDPDDVVTFLTMLARTEP